VVLALASELLRELHHYEILVYGLVLMVVMLFFPDGLIALPARLGRRLGRRRPPSTPAMGASVAP
jgi:ABC-type branched-subunit amino acid transport system permease subunit